MSKLVELVKSLRNTKIDPDAMEEIMAPVVISKIDWSEILTMDISSFDTDDWKHLGMLIPNPDTYNKISGYLFMRFGLSEKLKKVLGSLAGSLSTIPVSDVCIRYIVSTNTFSEIQDKYPNLENPNEYIILDMIEIEGYYLDSTWKTQFKLISGQVFTLVSNFNGILIRRNGYIDKLLNDTRGGSRYEIK